MKTYIYQIEAISNLHVGNGEANEGVVDKLIQKDATTGLPTINASSLKGAFREHLTRNLQGQDNYKSIISHIFGNEVNETEEQEKTLKENGEEKKKVKKVLVHQAGAYRFFDANLLSIPVRNSKSAYLMASCHSVLKELQTRIQLFKKGDVIKIDLSKIPNDTCPIVNDSNYENAIIEDLEDLAKKTSQKEIPNLEKLVGSPSVFLSDKDFQSMCEEDHLPIIARNHLENGISQNLWYEQVLPRLSRLYFMVMVPENDEHFEKFNRIITTSLVQIGANATVGYGYCSISQLPTTKA